MISKIDDDPYKAASERATTLVDRSPSAKASVKKLYRPAWAASKSDTLGYEPGLTGKLIGNLAQVEAATAAFEKRTLRFYGYLTSYIYVCH